MSENQEPVTVVIRYQARPGKEEAAREELAGVASVVLAQEPACLELKVCQDLDDPARFLLYERWADREAYLGPHMNTPHLRRFIERALEFFIAPPEITFWREVPSRSIVGS